MTEQLNLEPKTIQYKTQNKMIEDIQNVSIFAIGIFSLISCFYYYLQNESSVAVMDNIDSRMFDMLLPVVGVHAAVELFATNNYDLKIHHLCVLGICILIYNNYNIVTSVDRIIFSYPLLKTEISSIFYVLKYWIPTKSIFYHINTVCFYVSFFKLRILDFYYDILDNRSLFAVVLGKYFPMNPVNSCILFVLCCGLYVLNVYWFLIINKILYKNLIKVVNINTDKICHYLCSFTQFVNIPVSLYIYSWNKNEKYLFDMIGITSLSVFSYIYHYDIYKRLHQNEIAEYSVPDEKNVKYFIFDCVSIHVRGFLTLVTCYYTYEHSYPIFMFSGMYHLISIYIVVSNLFKLFIRPEDIKDVFLGIHNIIMMLSLYIFDVFASF
jgi:hypothetical protein